MQLITANCPACGGSYGGRLTSRFITCEYCGTRFALSDEELSAFGFTDADKDGFDDNDPGRNATRDEDTSSAPMYAYAREACEKFLKRVDQSSFSSSRKIEYGLGIENSDDIYLIHDDTMFKSGKNGFAITREGLYCREFGDRNAHFLSWEDFAEGGWPALSDSYIRQDGTSICYFTDDSELRETKLLKLYEQLYQHACKVL